MSLFGLPELDAEPELDFAEESDDLDPDDSEDLELDESADLELEESESDFAGLAVVDADLDEESFL